MKLYRTRSGNLYSVNGEMIKIYDPFMCGGRWRKSNLSLDELIYVGAKLIGNKLKLK